ncbi:MAG TPA: VOC family protein [Alphaproteobacteria bacterium]|nr:VOC family protein [Alphaproteobacteria bacterium]
MAAITQIGRVIIPSPDQDASIAFYTEKLGFTVAADVAYGEGNRWVELTPPGGGANIALGPPMGSFQPPHSTGIAISTKDARADYEELKAKGVDVDENLMGGDGPVPLMFGLRDNDGNNLMIVERVDRGQ